MPWLLSKVSIHGAETTISIKREMINQKLLNGYNISSGVGIVSAGG